MTALHSYQQWLTERCSFWHGEQNEATGYVQAMKKSSIKWKTDCVGKLNNPEDISVEELIITEHVSCWIVYSHLCILAPISRFPNEQVNVRIMKDKEFA
jgi:hypothetical protein